VTGAGVSNAQPSFLAKVAVSGVGVNLKRRCSLEKDKRVLYLRTDVLRQGS
jgi:hypothetical protein